MKAIMANKARTLPDEPIRPKRIEAKGQGEAAFYAFKASKSLGTMIDKYATDNGLPTRSAALRDMVERAVEQPHEQTGPQ